MGIPTYWFKAREAYLRSIDRWHEFNKRGMELTVEKVGFEEKQEILDGEFGITYQVLKPFIDQVNAEARAKRKRKEAPAQSEGSGAEPDRGEAEPDPASSGAGIGDPEPVGGDIADVRWALANLSKQGVGPKDSPSAIAWNLLVIGRGGTQGQLKLLDIYRATIIQPAAKAAEQAPVEGPDGKLEELLERLGAGLGDTEASG